MSISVSFAVSIHVSLYLNTSSVLLFNRLNFPRWCEQVQFDLRALDHYLALKVKKIIAITMTVYEKAFHKT